MEAVEADVAADAAAAVFDGISARAASDDEAVEAADADEDSSSIVAKPAEVDDDVAMVMLGETTTVDEAETEIAEIAGDVDSVARVDADVDSAAAVETELMAAICKQRN